MLKNDQRPLMPDGGNVQCKGQDTKETDLIELRRWIGYVIQGGALFSAPDVRENIEYVPRLRKKQPLGGSGRATKL